MMVNNFWIGVACAIICPKVIRIVMLPFLPLLHRIGITSRPIASIDSTLPPPLIPPQRALYENMESAWWFNRILSQIWTKQAPYLSDALHDILQSNLNQHCPPFLSSLHLIHLSIGSRAPQISNLKTFRTSQDTMIVLDVDFDWICSDAEFKLGTSLHRILIPIVRVHTLRISAKFRIQLELRAELLAVKALSFSLLKIPKITFAIEPLSSGFNICSIPALSNWLYGFLSVIITRPFIWPLSFCVNLGGNARNTGSNQREIHRDLSHNSSMQLRIQNSEALKQLIRTVKRILSVISTAPDRIFTNSNTNSHVNQSLRVHPREASLPAGTKGILSVRVVEARQLLSQSKSHHSMQHTSTIVTLQLRSETLSTRRIYSSSSPYYDDLLEMHVLDESHDVVLLQVFEIHPSHLVPGAHRRVLLGSAWVGVKEAVDQSSWLDMWLRLMKMADSSSSSTASLSSQSNSSDEESSANLSSRGFLRVQLAYEQIMDSSDVEADVRRRQQLEKQQQKEAKAESDTERKVLGYWQVHVLEGVQWTRPEYDKNRNRRNPVRDARCDLRCGKQVFRSRRIKSVGDDIVKDGENRGESIAFGEYFELEVRDPISDVLHITGVDEDPFVKHSMIGDCVIALDGIGDVQPTDLWVRLRRIAISRGRSSSRSSRNRNESSVLAGWLHIWISFRSVYQDCANSNWNQSNVSLVLNPSRRFLLNRAIHIEQSTGITSTRSQNVQEMQLMRTEPLAGSILAGAISQLTTEHLFGLARRLPRQLFGWGSHLVYDDVIGNVERIARGDLSMLHRQDTLIVDDDEESEDEDDETSGEGLEVSSDQVILQQDLKPIYALLLEVYTGKGFGSGIDRDVTIEVLDDAGHVAGQSMIMKDSQRTNKTKCDLVVMESSIPITQVTSLRVTHSGSGWKLDRIRVYDAVSNPTIEESSISSTRSVESSAASSAEVHDPLVFEFDNWLGTSRACVSTEIVLHHFSTD